MVTTSQHTGTTGHARAVAEQVTDPELPMLTLADLGILREVSVRGNAVRVTITPTYSGCPALETMRADLVAALTGAGYSEVDVRTVLDPPWTTDWISERGRRKLTEAGIAPPGPADGHGGGHGDGPVPLTLHAPAPRVPCPRCGSVDTRELSRFGATACKALWQCRACREPFERVKEI
ncbi:1,2-phenylacetyl-CoA epoxidase subunit PaaD [Haloechinothrix sp. LS1_15]|uniref:1,2-phenylacetyl-CoA epoxidase subunit PaaD n=1 Tax=Haloechinothrix sp. LS1_15 TaxID=2652248 RepID=UPI00294555A6|nr:1,2-phenylacetyl-CoA epoxidase subunit PaaD [Haloechinothrix sp. LS1_15]MDV6013677.1 phenylacetate-CoA oxygenase subunit PaaJ [Haloechinothrix sp. LS1_15]